MDWEFGIKNKEFFFRTNKKQECFNKRIDKEIKDSKQMDWLYTILFLCLLIFLLCAIGNLKQVYYLWSISKQIWVIASLTCLGIFTGFCWILSWQHTHQRQILEYIKELKK